MNLGKQPRPRIDRAEGEVPDPETPENPEEEAAEQAATLDGDEELQREVLGKIRTYNEKGKQNRMAEVGNARDQRLYFRGIQQFYWSEDKQDVIFESDDDSPYDRTFNVFQGYGKIFQSTFMGAKPKVRAEADDPFDDASIRAAAKAKVYERVYRKFNDISDTQLELSRLMFTDGRITTLTAHEDGNEVTKFYGVLESRVPIHAKCLKECPLVQLEDEFPISQMKQQYPDARKKINSGNGDSYERNARIAVKRQAGSDTSIDVLSGEDSYGLATKTISIMRPEFFEEFQESTRVQLQEMFEDGLCVVHTGDVYLESYPYVMDDHVDVLHALPGDGMSRPSIGASIMPLQDSVNTTMNLTEETFDHGIPTTYYDTKTDIDNLNRQREMPGSSRKATGLQGQPLSSAFFQTTPLNPSQQLMNYGELIRGPLMQFMSGQQPALFGGQMEDQKTASGYAQARTMALGQMAIVWKPFTSWYARETTRAVKLASQRQEEITANISPTSANSKPEAVRIAPGELAGASFTNESDENFPESYTERKNALMGLLQMGGEFSDMILKEEPDNLYLVAEMVAIPGLVIPGKDSRDKQIAEIAQMEHEGPVPDPSQMPEQPMPQMGQPPAPPVLTSSVPLQKRDKDEVELAECERWLNSAQGQEAFRSNPTWYQNVSLHADLHEARIQQKQQANAPPPPPIPPKVAINYDSLPVTGKIQAAAQDGIHLTAQDIATVPVKSPTAPAGATNG